MRFEAEASYAQSKLCTIKPLEHLVWLWTYYVPS